MSANPIIDEVIAECEHQDQKWGEGIDLHSTKEFIDVIADYATRAWFSADTHDEAKARRRLIQIAARAVAAVESYDRKQARQDSAA